MNLGMRLLAASVDAFCDHSGGISVMRIMSFLVCVVVLGLWVAFCFIEGRYIPLGWAEAGLIGAACGAKAAQSRFELGSAGLGVFEEHDPGRGESL